MQASDRNNDVCPLYYFCWYDRISLYFNYVQNINSAIFILHSECVRFWKELLFPASGYNSTQ